MGAQVIKLRSTAIETVCYDAQRKVLGLTIIGRTGERRSYNYLGVPRDVFDGLVKAESAGRYYNQFIAGVFDSAKVEVA